MNDNRPPSSANGAPLNRPPLSPGSEGQARVGQNFQWGQVKWLVEPDSLGAERVSVGLVIFKPRSDDREHSHFGEEQVIYVLSGSGRQLVNGQPSAFTAGDTLYIPPYSRHTMFNDGDEELRVLTVYIPSRARPILEAPDGEVCDLADKFDLLSFLDAEVIKKLLNELAQSIHQSIRLLDTDGTSLLASDNLPALCRGLGQCGDHCRHHIRQSLGEINSFNKSHLVTCCGQVTSIIIPIVSNNIVSGYVKCGEFFLSDDDRSATGRYLESSGRLRSFLDGRDLGPLLESVTLDKKNTIYTLAENTVTVARTIAEMSMTMARQKEKENHQLSMLRGQMNEARLKQALQEAELKLLQAQLNPHFLFNTLNTIGHLAYLEGAEEASSLIHNLSNILRTALGKVKTMVPLSEELELLRGYLSIQKARFGKRLQTAIEVEPGLDGVLIPGLTLQPIVENSIIHGVESNLGRVKVDIKIARRQDKVLLTVTDNGPGLQVEGPTAKGVGLGSVTARLHHHFKDDFSYELVNRPGGGVRTTMLIPLGLTV